MSDGTANDLMLVTGLSGAGKSTVLRALEDLGWEVVDNLPLSLLPRLIASPPPTDASGNVRALAVGIDTRTRGFDAAAVVRMVKQIKERSGRDISTLFLDCSAAELDRRFAETRRRHPLAEDRPVADGVAREREMLDPLRRWADQLIDTTDFAMPDLQREVRARFAHDDHGPMTITIMSFGFARGQPRNADLIFDVRFLRNPHWDEQLRPGTGQDDDVIAYIAEDPAYETAVSQFEDLLTTLIPRYAAAGRHYLTIAFGCTGGRHRSVHVAERVAATLRARGIQLHLMHRNLNPADQARLEGDGPSA